MLVVDIGMLFKFASPMPYICPIWFQKVPNIQINYKLYKYWFNVTRQVSWCVTSQLSNAFGVWSSHLVLVGPIFASFGVQRGNRCSDNCKLYSTYWFSVTRQAIWYITCLYWDPIEILPFWSYIYPMWGM